jgi:uncharacterized protein (TIGR00255 family)
MKSMTGYGRGTAAAGGCSLTVEISAVNGRKQVDMRFSLPRELAMLEPVLRQGIQARLSRGSLYVAVAYQLAEQGGGAGRVNQALALAVAKELKELAEAAALPEVRVSDVLAVPGVLDTSAAGVYEPLKALAEPALAQALDALLEARQAEGLRLKEDLAAHGEAVRAHLEAIAAREPEAQREFKARLMARLAELGAPIAPDDERLAKELCFYADKSDINEETVRLRSHLVKYFELLESDGDPGRELDFLGQEMNREVNTLSAKTSDLSISGEALAMKIELSKIREQIMNIE